MNHILKMCIVLIAITNIIGAQTPKFVWAKKIGFPYPGSIVCDGGERIYINGHGGGPFVSCLDAEGNKLWEKRFSSMGYGESIDLDNVGNVYTMGSFSGTISFDPPQNNYTLLSSNWNVYLSKLDPAGNCLMAARLGGNRETYGYGMDVDRNGNIYSTGSFSDTSDFDPGVSTYELIADSVYDWRNPFPSPEPPIGLYDVFLSKVDQSGKFIWARQVGGKYGDRGRVICADASENVYSLGYFETSAKFEFNGDNKYPLTSEDDFDVFLTKRNKYGYCLWVKQWDIKGVNKNRSLVLDSQGNILITGWFSGSVDFDPGLSTQVLVSNGEEDAFILKLDSNGNFLWVKQIGGSGIVRGNSITTDLSFNIYVIGSFSGTTDFDPNEGIKNLTSKEEKDLFVMKIDPSGAYNWAIHLDGSGIYFGNGRYGGEALSLATDDLENLYVFGPFSGSVDFDPGGGQHWLESDKDCFVLKLSSEMVGVSSTFVPENIYKLYPNPAKDLITIQGSHHTNSQYNILDINGKKLISGYIKDVNTVVDIAALKNGIYFMEIQGRQFQWLKFIKSRL